MCVNYGGRAELVDATIAIAREVAKRKLKPEQITEKLLTKHLYNPQMRDVDLFLRSSGEQRTSNFLPWQSAYAEMVFLDVLWPDVDRRTLWKAIEIYAERERRFGKA
jgi:undecaprenyl diphosphate synthase